MPGGDAVGDAKKWQPANPTESQKSKIRAKQLFYQSTTTPPRLLKRTTKAGARGSFPNAPPGRVVRGARVVRHDPGVHHVVWSDKVTHGRADLGWAASTPSESSSQHNAVSLKSAFRVVKPNGAVVPPHPLRARGRRGRYRGLRRLGGDSARAERRGVDRPSRRQATTRGAGERDGAGGVGRGDA